MDFGVNMMSVMKKKKKRKLFAKKKKVEVKVEES